MKENKVMKTCFSMKFPYNIKFLTLLQISFCIPLRLFSVWVILIFLYISSVLGGKFLEKTVQLLILPKQNQILPFPLSYPRSCALTSTSPWSHAWPGRCRSWPRSWRRWVSERLGWSGGPRLASASSATYISSKNLTQVHHLTVSVPACFNSHRFGIHRTLWHTMKTEIKKMQGFIQKQLIRKNL